MEFGFWIVTDLSQLDCLDCLLRLGENIRLTELLQIIKDSHNMKGKQSTYIHIIRKTIGNCQRISKCSFNLSYLTI